MPQDQDLFGSPEPEKTHPPGASPSREGIDPSSRPLADRLRPQTLDEVIGQEKLVGENAPLRRLIRSDKTPSMILWGPPGCGKTTLAYIVASETNADYISLSAVTSGIKDVRGVIDHAKVNRKFGRKTILFIDEIHRFNKAQQDAFLPHVESGLITLIGATTENPSFSVISPLLSRCRVFTFDSLKDSEVVELLHRGLVLLNKDPSEGEPEIGVTDEAFKAIASFSDGDARRALGMLEVAIHAKARNEEEAGPLTAEEVMEIAQRTLMYDKSGEEHFNLISALHKTMRSSDPHGAVYWLGRMLAAGEDPLYLFRRMIRFAGEDIGLADPFALNQSMECMRAYQHLGSPEGDLMLAQCAIYLALAPKSNSLYAGWNAVQAEIASTGSLPVPFHLRNAPTGLMKDLGYGKEYTYDHEAAGHFTPKQGLPDRIAEKTFYHPSDQGREPKLAQHLAEWDRQRRESLKKKKKKASSENGDEE